jgi:uncharacterized protein YdhG (YjbR/CyaY superfamily)
LIVWPKSTTANEPCRDSISLSSSLNHEINFKEYYFFMSSKDVDNHLARIQEPHRKTLETLRKYILELIPEAEEVISYGFPGFKINGKIICGFDAFKNHCSFFPHSSLVIPELEKELVNYKTSKGAIQFDIGKPLPKDLVRKLIKVRMTQLGAVSKKAK